MVKVGQKVSFRFIGFKGKAMVVAGTVDKITTKMVVLKNCSDGRPWHVGVNWIFCLDEGE